MKSIGDSLRVKVNDVEAGWFRAFVESYSGAGRTDAFGRVGEPASPLTAGVCMF